MKDFIYDGSFEGLLTAIFEANMYKGNINIIEELNYTPSLLNEKVIVKTDLKKFNRVYNSIKNNLGNYVLINVYHLYLCSIVDSKNLLFKYLKLCYKHGNSINLAKNNDIIFLVDKYCRKVTIEAERFTGFVRFKEIAPLTFYSSIEPDHNILPLLINHFKKRFSDENFIIHDYKRDIAIINNIDNIIITDFNKEDAKSLINCPNSKYESLWKTFYNSINIKERQNLRQRNMFMPKRYWKNITELK